MYNRLNAISRTQKHLSKKEKNPCKHLFEKKRNSIVTSKITAKKKKKFLKMRHTVFPR